MIDKKRDLTESWYKLSNLAKLHTAEQNRFNQLAEEYYGTEWNRLPSLRDNDRIIDTLDYGIDSLTFTEFDELMRKVVLLRRENARLRGGIEL